jgi:hypothetical protein
MTMSRKRTAFGACALLASSMAVVSYLSFRAVPPRHQDRLLDGGSPGKNEGNPGGVDSLPRMSGVSIPSQGTEKFLKSPVLRSPAASRAGLDASTLTSREALVVDDKYLSEKVESFDQCESSCGRACYKNALGEWHCARECKRDDECGADAMCHPSGGKSRCTYSECSGVGDSSCGPKSTCTPVSRPSASAFVGRLWRWPNL